MRHYLVIFCLLAVVGVIAAPKQGFANHPVLVEGEADFDGDGLIGVDEDLDGDRIYGTLSAALGADLGAVNNNGKVTVVTSGRFPESLVISSTGGNLTLEAAPGVEANIDAVLAGLPGNVERQGMPGITIDTSASSSIILRNLTVRNWSTGIIVLGDSRVVLDNVRVEQNLDYGILASGHGVFAAITHSQVIGTGFRVGAAGSAPTVVLPAPGAGIQFENGAKGSISNSSSIGNFGKGLIVDDADVKKKNLIRFNND